MALTTAKSAVSGPLLRGVGHLIKRTAVSWAAIVALLVAWEVLFRIRDEVYFPPVSEIFQAMVATYLSPDARQFFMTEAMREHLLPSLSRLGAGWLIALVVALTLGTLIGLLPIVEDYVDPVIQFLRAVPPPAVIPIFLLFFGIGDTMKIFLIVFSAIWPILINTIDGVGQVPRQFIDTATVYGIRRARLLFGVVLPAASPRIFAGVRISLSVAIVLMVLSEMVAATNGIGFSILFAQRTFLIVDMWAGIFILGGLGYFLNLVLSVLENRLLSWHRGARA